MFKIAFLSGIDRLIFHGREATTKTKVLPQIWTMNESYIMSFIVIMMP